MTEPAINATAPRRTSGGRAREAIFLISLALLCGGLGITLHGLMDLPAPTAGLIAISTFSVMLAIHSLARRATLSVALNAEIAQLRAEISGLRAARSIGGGGGGDASYRGLSESGRRTGAGPALRGHASAPPRVLAGADGSPLLHPGPQQQGPSDAPPSGLSGQPMADPRGADAANPEHAPRKDATAPASAATLDWTVRPGSHREPAAKIAMAPAHAESTGPLPLIQPKAEVAVQTSAPVPHAADASGPQANAEPSPLDGLVMPAPDGAPRTMSRPDAATWPQAAPNVPTAPLDLDMMQNLIEQLAVQLQPQDTEKTIEAAQPAPPVTTARRPRQPPEAPVLPQAQRPRDVAPPLPAPAPRPAAPFGHLALITDAVEAKRMDVFLDPILGLSDRKARHFELSVRLIGPNGYGFAEADYVKMAAGTGLLARIDAAKLTRAAGVLQRLRDRGSEASLFSMVAGESLADENFAGAFAEILAAEEGQETRLVLTFDQAEARNFTPAHWRTVSEMSKIGLKFALSAVTDLDMDFELLKRHGFDFIKLDAVVFLEGLPMPSGRIPASDICRHLANLGLGLIVGGIVAENDLARILGFGALLGQGTLFGGPRSVELERERAAA